jgi:hypothetical protein
MYVYKMGEGDMSWQVAEYCNLLDLLSSSKRWHCFQYLDMSLEQVVYVT